VRGGSHIKVKLYLWNMLLSLREHKWQPDMEQNLVQKSESDKGPALCKSDHIPKAQFTTNNP